MGRTGSFRIRLLIGIYLSSTIGIYLSSTIGIYLSTSMPLNTIFASTRNQCSDISIRPIVISLRHLLHTVLSPLVSLLVRVPSARGSSPPQLMAHSGGCLWTLHC